METSHTSFGSAESRLIHFRGHRPFPNFGRGRWVESGPARAPETIEHEGRKMTHREVMAEKEKKMSELRKKIDETKKRKDSLKQTIETNKKKSPLGPENYDGDAGHLASLEQEIDAMEQRMQTIEKTSWRSVLSVIKDAQSMHDRTIENIKKDLDMHIGESMDSDSEREARRGLLLSRANSELSWYRENIAKPQSMDTKYMNVLSYANTQIGHGAALLPQWADNIKRLADDFEAMPYKNPEDREMFLSLRTLEKSYRDLYQPMHEHEQKVMKMQNEQKEKESKLSPNVARWREGVAKFLKNSKTLDARKLVAEGHESYVDGYIENGKYLQAEFQALSTYKILNGTDSALNDDIGRVLPQLEALKVKVKGLMRAEKQQKVLEPIQALQGLSGADVVNVLGGESRSALEKVKGMIKDLEGVAQEILDDGVRAASPEAQALVPPMNELKRIQTEMEGVMGIEHQERGEYDTLLVQEADILLNAPLNTFNEANLRAHIKQLKAMMKNINARLDVNSPSTDAYPELQRKSLDLGVRLEAAKERQRLPETWVNFRMQRSNRLSTLAKDRAEKAARAPAGFLRNQLMADADYFKAKSTEVFRDPMPTFQDNVAAERIAVPAKREELTRQLNLFAEGTLGRLTAQRLLDELPTDLGTVPDMA